ncbi:MAG: NfeD family protein [Planctomycetota bacterium]|nr:NfeD family protein [Planctomycetota bacterium]
MDPNIIWAITLITIGAALIFLELFIPSGGLIGIASVGCFIVATYLGYQAGDTAGMATLCCSVVVIGVMIYLALKVWPHTPMGRNAIPTDEDPAGAITKPLEHLVGLRGFSTSSLMPNGRIEIDGKAYDAVSPGTIIEEGCSIEVLSIESNRILVTQVDDIVRGKETIAKTNEAAIKYSTFEDDLEQSLGE